MYNAFKRRKEITSIFLFFSVLLYFSPVSLAQTSILNSPVSIQLTNVSVRDALKAVGDQAGARFSYSSTQLDLEKKVTVSFNKKPLSEALEILLGRQLKGLSVADNTITIQTSSGRGNISGQVTTSDGQAAEFVTILIKGIRSTQVDARGNYLLKDIEAGDYTVIASFIGRVSQQKEVTVAAGKTASADFVLSENNEQLQEVVVNGGKNNKFAVKKTTTSAKMPLGNLENPQVYTTIPKTLLTEQMVTEFSTTLKNSPGVYKIQGSRGINSDGASFYSMRGFRTEAALADGVPSQTNGEIEPAQIERVELIKGPSGTLYGGAVVSFGGLINIVTKKPVDTLGGEISYTTGSYNLNRLTADVYGPADKHKKILFRLNTAYQNQNSFQDAGFRKSIFVSPALEYRASEKLNISLNAAFYELQGTSPSVIFLNRVRKFIATKPEELNFNWDRSFTSNDLVMKNPTTNFKAQVNYKLSDKWTSQTIYSSNTRKSDGFYQYEFIRGATSDEMLERNVSLQNSVNTSVDIQQNFVGDFKLFGLRNRMVVGLDYLNQTVNNSNSPYIVFDNVSGLNPADPNYIKISRSAVEAQLAASTAAPTKNTGTNNIYSAYASNVSNVTDRLLAMLSLRVDRFQNKGIRNQADNTLSGNYMQTAVSPKFGLVYQVLKDRVSLFGNYMNGFSNLPPVTQPAGSGASNKFKPQQANQVEGGVKVDLFDGRLSFTSSYYDISVTNMTRTEAVTVNSVNYVITVQNGTQKSKGVEFELITNPVDGLNIIAGYSYNDSKLVKATTALEGRRPASAGPSSLFNSWTSYTMQTGKLKGLGLGVGANYIGDHLTANSAVTGVFTLPAYLLMSTTAFYEKDRYRLGIKVDNLTDKLYFTGQGVLSAQMPRTIAANVSIKF